MSARRAVIRADLAVLDHDAAAAVESGQRRQHRGAGGLDHRLGGQSRFELAEEARRRSPSLVTPARQADSEREAIVRLDAGRLRQYRLEASQREAGADQQHRCQSDLDDDEAKPERALQADGTPAAILERFSGIFADQVPRRQRTRQQSGDQACDEREGEDRQAENHGLIRPRHRGQLRGQHANRPDREDQSRHTTGECHHRAFDEHLPHQPCAGRANGRAHRHLAPAPGGLRQQQVRHVDARDQQDEGDRGHQHDERALHGAGDLFRQRRHVRAVAAAQLRILRLEVLADAIHLRARLRQRHLRLEPRIHGELMRGA